jgi:hypothetical protein
VLYFAFLLLALHVSGSRGLITEWLGGEGGFLNANLWGAGTRISRKEYGLRVACISLVLMIVQVCLVLTTQL